MLMDAARLTKRILAICRACVCLAAGFSADQLLPAQEVATFTVQPLTGQNTFRIGERIPLQLSFSSLRKDRYEINLASYDRSGRMSYEQFDVSPKTGWSDPLAQYFSLGGAGGGLSTIGVITSTPTVMSLDLNEWVRFDHPGIYRVTVASRRLTDVTQKHVFNGEPSSLVQAKSFILHIVPATPEWQAAKLQVALTALQQAPVAMGQQSPERKDAIADLRFLGTEEALKVLAANLRDDHADLMYQCAFGLMGVPDSMRDITLKIMEQKLSNPLFPISQWFIQAMATLEVNGSVVGAEAIFESRLRTNAEMWRKVLAALPRKLGKARAATAQTLLGSPPADLDRESERELASVLSASFLDLTEEQRGAELMWHWDLLRSPSMLPVLEASAKLPLTHPGSNRVDVYSRREFKSIALARWYELDPAGATQEILLEIGSATPSLTAQSLTFLPKQTFPQFESIWAQRLGESKDYEEETVLGGLLVHFGIGTASAQVERKLRAKMGAWECAPQAAALAYIVRFDSEQAKPLLDRALGAGGAVPTGCHHSLFQDVSAHASGAVLSDAAVASLDNPDRQVTMDALIYLTDHGREEDQKPIWDRYVKWSQQWSSKAEELDSQDRASFERIYPEIGVGENLVHALIANQGWLADDHLVAETVRMCVGVQVCQQAQQLAALASPPHHVTLYQSPSSETYQVAQYAAKSMELLDEKLAQYPKGTAFVLTPSSLRNADQEALEKEAQELFKRNGLSLLVAAK